MIRWVNEFENSDEGQRDYCSVRDRSRSSREGQGEQSNPENETITRPTRGIKPIRFRVM